MSRIYRAPTRRAGRRTLPWTLWWRIRRRTCADFEIILQNKRTDIDQSSEVLRIIIFRGFLRCISFFIFAANDLLLAMCWFQLSTDSTVARPTLFTRVALSSKFVPALCDTFQISIVPTSAQLAVYLHCIVYVLCIFTLCILFGAWTSRIELAVWNNRYKRVAIIIMKSWLFHTLLEITLRWIQSDFRCYLHTCPVLFVYFCSTVWHFFKDNVWIWLGIEEWNLALLWLILVFHVVRLIRILCCSLHTVSLFSCPWTFVFLIESSEWCMTTIMSQ